MKAIEKVHLRGYGCLQIFDPLIHFESSISHVKTVSDFKKTLSLCFNF